MDRGGGVEASRWAPSTSRPTTSHHRHRTVLAGETSRRRGGEAPSSENSRARPLPLNDETPTRPRIRPAGNRRR
jgi:F-box and WD-40 domain protein CDC4